MKLKVVSIILTSVLFISCAKNEKKVMVLIKGKGTVNEEAKTINIKEGFANEEKEMNFNTKESVTLKIVDDKIEKTATIAENGYYLLNAKNDTIIGTIQNYSTEKPPTDTFTVITQAMIQKNIDSLVALTQGKLSSNTTFFIQPYQAVKITNNINATIIAPYHNFKKMEQEDGKALEVYRFYTIAEIRKKIEEQTKLTKAKKTEQVPMGNGGKKS